MQLVLRHLTRCLMNQLNQIIISNLTLLMFKKLAKTTLLTRKRRKLNLMKLFKQTKKLTNTSLEKPSKDQLRSAKK